MQAVKLVFVAAVGIGAVNVIDHLGETGGETVFRQFVVPLIPPDIQRVYLEKVEVVIVAKLVLARQFVLFVRFVQQSPVFSGFLIISQTRVTDNLVADSKIIGFRLHQGQHLLIELQRLPEVLLVPVCHFKHIGRPVIIEGGILVSPTFVSWKSLPTLFGVLICLVEETRLA